MLYDGSGGYTPSIRNYIVSAGKWEKIASDLGYESVWRKLKNFGEKVKNGIKEAIKKFWKEIIVAVIIGFIVIVLGHIGTKIIDYFAGW